MSKQGEKTNKMKVLSFDSIKEKHEEKFEMVENHVFLDDETYSYKMYEKFPKTLENKFITDVLQFSYDISSNDEMEDFSDSTAVFVIITMIEKFTDLEIPSDYGERILYAEVLSDLGILEPIMVAFDEDEFTRVMSKTEEVLTDKTRTVSERLEEFSAEAEEIEEMSNLRMVEKDLKSEEKWE